MAEAALATETAPEVLASPEAAPLVAVQQSTLPTQLETINITGHPTHGDFGVEVPVGMPEAKVREYINGLDLDLMLGFDDPTSLGETNVEQLKAFENSVGAGKRNDKWFPHSSLEGGPDTVAYGHKLTQAETETGMITIGDTEVDWREGLSDDQAIGILNQDAEWAKHVAGASLVKANLQDDIGKVQSLTSLIYNVGSGAWGRSKAKMFLEAGMIEDFLHEAFSPEEGFVKINGDKSRGLVRRRAAEQELWSGGATAGGSEDAGGLSSILSGLNPIGTANASTVTSQVATNQSVLKRGSTDTEGVGILQDLLGMDVGEDKGIFGPATEAAVKAFQEEQGLTVDGLAGKDTFARLERSNDATVPSQEDLEKTEKSLIQEATALFDGVFSREGSRRILTRVLRKSTAVSLLPDNLELLVTDILFKNILGVPLGGAELNENDLDRGNLDLAKQISYQVIKGGGTSVDYGDYPLTKRGLPASGIVGGTGSSKGDAMYPTTALGFAKLALDSYTDPVVTLATTLGGWTLTEEDGVWYATDKYDAQKFKRGSRSKGWYGEFRNVLSDHGTTEEQSDPEDKIKWRIRLGTMEELAKAQNTTKPKEG